MDDLSISVDEKLVAKIEPLVKSSLLEILGKIDPVQYCQDLEKSSEVAIALLSVILKAAGAMACSVSIREELFIGLAILFYRRAAEEMEEVKNIKLN